MKLLICAGIAAGLIAGFLSYLPLKKALHLSGRKFFPIWMAGIFVRFILVLAFFLYFIRSGIVSAVAFLIPFIFTQEITLIFLIRKRNKETG